MIGRYEHRFGELEERGHKAFIPFTVLGWPDADACVAQAGAMIRAGSAALELGFPFSDPVADGPVIQRASHEVLKAGFGVDDAFKVIDRIREFGTSTPLGVLVYYNMVLAQGIEKFFARCRFAGIDGVLIADLPAENIHEVLPAASESNVRLISLVSPVTSCERIELITKNASGFLYLVSRLGVTGTGRRDSESDALLSQVIAQIKARTAVPICAGFGVSTREQARNMLSLGADGVITGSRVIEIIRAAQPEEAATALYDFCCDMVQECSDFGVPSCRG